MPLSLTHQTHLQHKSIVTHTITHIVSHTVTWDNQSTTNFFKLAHMTNQTQHCSKTVIRVQSKAVTEYVGDSLETVLSIEQAFCADDDSADKLYFK